MTPPFAPAGLDHIVLRVADLERMRDFYVTVLGCRIEKVQEALGLHQLRAGSSLIDLITLDGPLGRAGGAPPGREGRNLDHFCLQVAPFDPETVRAHLARHGIATEPAGDRYGAGGQGPSLYLTDPEGNVVELRAPPAASQNGAPPRKP